MPLTSRSQDFWYSHSAFWEVKKALPRWTLHSRGVSENLLWSQPSFPSQRCVVSAIARVLRVLESESPLCCSTEWARSSPPPPAGCVLLCGGPVGWHVWPGLAGASRAALDGQSRHRPPLLQLKGCGCSARGCASGSVLQAPCIVPSRHGDAITTFLCRKSRLSRAPEAGQSGQGCIGRSLLRLGGRCGLRWTGRQHLPLGTLCNSSQAFPVHYFSPSRSRSRPSLSQPPSCVRSWRALLAELSGKAWPG